MAELTPNIIRTYLQNQASRKPDLISPCDLEALLAVLPEGNQKLDRMDEDEVFGYDPHCYRLQSVVERLDMLGREGAETELLQRFFAKDFGLKFLLTGDLDMNLVTGHPPGQEPEEGIGLQ